MKIQLKLTFNPLTRLTVMAKLPRGDLSNKYPRAIKFIIGQEFCERFSYYGMRAVLV